MFQCDRYPHSSWCDNLVSELLNCASSLCFVVSKKCPQLFQWSQGLYTCYALVLRLIKYVAVAIHHNDNTNCILDNIVWKLWTEMCFLLLKILNSCFQQFPRVIMMNLMSIFLTPCLDLCIEVLVLLHILYRIILQVDSHRMTYFLAHPFL